MSGIGHKLLRPPDATCQRVSIATTYLIISRLSSTKQCVHDCPAMSRPRTYEANELDPACNKPLKSFYPSHNITHSTSDQPRKRKHGEFTAQVTGQHDIGNPFNIQVE